MATKFNADEPVEIQKHEPGPEAAQDGILLIADRGAVSRETKGIPGWIFEFGAPPFYSRGT